MKNVNEKIREWAEMAHEMVVKLEELEATKLELATAQAEIKALKAELDEVKGENKAIKARSAAFEDDETTDVSDATVIPAAATLAQNTPNPFSERTTIRFTLPENAQQAYIYVFDMSGKMYKQIPVNSSMQSVTIEGYELSAGMYIYSLVIGGKEVQTRRMILSK